MDIFRIRAPPAEQTEYLQNQSRIAIEHRRTNKIMFNAAMP